MELVEVEEGGEVSEHLVPDPVSGLVALLDLPGRELPIQPYICGQQLTLTPGQRIKLTGPDNLSLELQESP